MRRYSDAQLIDAVATSHSWRGVLRELGLASASSIRTVRRHADRLGLDSSHFTGQRRWAEADLRAAVADSTTWVDVAERLGLAGGSSTATLRAHALRLGLDASHFRPVRPAPEAQPFPNVQHLRRAGSLMAAAWFELCGNPVSWPLEPCRYDLLVWRDSGAERIQVKTTTFKSGSSWVARITSSGDSRTPYDPEDIDRFFIINGDLDFYLIPVDVVGGLTTIHLSAYAQYRLSQDLARTVESADACPD